MKEPRIELTPSYAKEVAELVTRHEDLRKLRELVLDDLFTNMRIDLRWDESTPRFSVVLDTRGDFAGKPVRFDFPGGVFFQQALIAEVRKQAKQVDDRLHELGVIPMEEP